MLMVSRRIMFPRKKRKTRAEKAKKKKTEDPPVLNATTEVPHWQNPNTV